jgi:Fic family protein
MLAAEGYPPVYLAGYLKNNQREYYDTLAGVQLKEKWVDWIRFFSVGVEVAAQESMALALALEKIMGKWTDQVAALGLRSDAVLHRFPGLLVGVPVLSVQLAQKMLGVSFPAASSALAKLEEMGILFRPTWQKRNRMFIAKEVIDVLNRPSGG